MWKVWARILQKYLYFVVLQLVLKVLSKEKFDVRFVICSFCSRMIRRPQYQSEKLSADIYRSQTMDGANCLFWIEENGFILLAKIRIKLCANVRGTFGKSQYCSKRDTLSVKQHFSHKIPGDVTVWTTFFHHSVINIAIIQFVSTTSVIWDQTIIVP